MVSPKTILDFWFGPLQTIQDANEENWRERMLKWRIGIYARNHKDIEFDTFQKDQLGLMYKICKDEGWKSNQERNQWFSTPTGLLASIIMMDQFPRSIFRGTDKAYSFDKVTHKLLDIVLRKQWDITEYNIIQRLFVYVALSHPEDIKYQRLSNMKWTKWSNDLVEQSPVNYKKVNEYISWHFMIAIYEHSVTVLEFDRFPHRNCIFGRESKPKETKWLNHPKRPYWSYSQPSPNKTTDNLIDAVLDEIEENEKKLDAKYDQIDEILDQIEKVEKVTNKKQQFLTRFNVETIDDWNDILTQIECKTKEAKYIYDMMVNNKPNPLCQCMIDFVVKAIKERAAFDKSMLFYSWYFVINDSKSKEADPFEHMLWKTIVSVYEQILSSSDTLVTCSEWQWFNEHILNSTIWFSPHPKIGKVNGKDDDVLDNILEICLCRELLCRVPKQSKNESVASPKAKIEDMDLNSVKRTM